MLLFCLCVSHVLCCLVNKRLFLIFAISSVISTFLSNYSTNGFSVNIEAINCSNDIDQSESGFEWGREGELFCKSADWSDMSLSCWAEFESVSSFFTSSVMASFCGETSWFVLIFLRPRSPLNFQNVYLGWNQQIHPSHILPKTQPHNGNLALTLWTLW